jgi:hypothetical protein
MHAVVLEIGEQRPKTPIAHLSRMQVLKERALCAVLMAFPSGVGALGTYVLRF